MSLVGISRSGAKSGTRKAEQSDDVVVDVLVDCHARIRQFLALAQAVARPGTGAADVVDACARCERYFVEALPLHVQDEERSVEPRLRALGDTPVSDALARMTREHGEHDAAVAALLARLRAGRESPGDEAVVAAIGPAALALARAMEDHLLLEETVLFPALQRLPLAERRAILEEIRARRTR